MEGWVKLYRSLLNWEWWDDHNVTRLFIYLLLAANSKDNKWRGVTIKRGQLLTSVANLGKFTGLSPKAIRVALNKLKSTNETASTGASHWTIITICNYDIYQDSEILRGKQQGKHQGNSGAKQGQSKGKAGATNKKDKKDKEGKKEKNISLIDLLLVDDSSFIPVWTKWVAYKKELGKPYRTLKGMQTKYNELLKMSGRDPVRAMNIVDQSIGEEWSGLFPLKHNQAPAVPGEDPVKKMMREANELMQKQGII